MRGNYLSVFGEYAEIIWRIWQIGVICGTQKASTNTGKYFNLFGEDAKRLLAYSPNTPRDIKVRISP